MVWPANEHQSRVGDRQWLAENRLRRPAFHPWMVRGDARGGGLFAVAMSTAQLDRLGLQLREVGIGRQSPAGHSVRVQGSAFNVACAFTPSQRKTLLRAHRMCARPCGSARVTVRVHGHQ